MRLIKGDLSLEYEPLFLLLLACLFLCINKDSKYIKDNECISINVPKGFLGGSDAQPDLALLVLIFSPLGKSLSARQMFGVGNGPWFQVGGLRR